MGQVPIKVLKAYLLGGGCPWPRRTTKKEENRLAKLNITKEGGDDISLSEEKIIDLQGKGERHCYYISVSVLNVPEG